MDSETASGNVPRARIGDLILHRNEEGIDAHALMVDTDKLIQDNDDTDANFPDWVEHASISDVRVLLEQLRHNEYQHQMWARQSAKAAHWVREKLRNMASDSDEKSEGSAEDDAMVQANTQFGERALGHP